MTRWRVALALPYMAHNVFPSPVVGFGGGRAGIDIGELRRCMRPSAIMRIGQWDPGTHRIPGPCIAARRRRPGATHLPPRPWEAPSSASSPHRPAAALALPPVPPYAPGVRRGEAALAPQHVQRLVFAAPPERAAGSAYCVVL